ncbi:MAG: ABC transporter permease [Acidimicrobiales bacterium]
MNAWTIAANSLRRYLRDRTALFFVVALPVLVVVIVGSTVAGFDKFHVGLVVEGHGPRTDELVAALKASPAIDVTVLRNATIAGNAVRRSEQAAAVIVPSDYDARIASGEAADVGLMGQPTSNSFIATQAAVQSVVADQAATVQAARFATAEVGGDFATQLARARRLAASAPTVAVTSRAVNTGGNTLPEGFSYSAPTMLVLFVFINALAGGGAIIESRRLGMYERIAATPATRWAIIGGETLTYFAIAALQSIIIVVLAATVFGVDWGSPLAAALLVGVWALVGTGAGVLSGTMFRTADQASSVGPPLGIVAGMLGGCMWPLEIVPPAMRTVGHLLPHAWAVDAWTILLSRDGGVGDIATQLAVLAGFAALLLGVATFRMRRHLAI